MELPAWLLAHKRKNHSCLFNDDAHTGGAVVIGVGTRAPRLLTTLEYAPHSMRGKPELTIKDPNKSKDGGLDKDYAI